MAVMQPQALLMLSLKLEKNYKEVMSAASLAVKILTKAGQNTATKKAIGNTHFPFKTGRPHGSQGRIDRDAQTFLDSQFKTRVSNAPGFTNNGRDDIDARIDVAYKDWVRFRAGYQRFNNVQTGEGAALALDNIGANNVDIYSMDVSANNKITDDLALESKIYFLGQHTDWDFKLLPPGTLGGFLPQGATSLAANFQGTTGLTTQFNYTGFKKHNVTPRNRDYL